LSVPAPSFNTPVPPRPILKFGPFAFAPASVALPPPTLKSNSPLVVAPTPTSISPLTTALPPLSANVPLAVKLLAIVSVPANVAVPPLYL
jgi:hypothetical protein